MHLITVSHIRTGNLPWQIFISLMIVISSWIKILYTGRNRQPFIDIAGKLGFKIFLLGKFTPTEKIRHQCHRETCIVVGIIRGRVNQIIIGSFEYKLRHIGTIEKYLRHRSSSQVSGIGICRGIRNRQVGIIKIVDKRIHRHAVRCSQRLGKPPRIRFSYHGLLGGITTYDRQR